MKEGLVGRIVLYAKTAAYFDFVMREPGNKFFDDVGSLVAPNLLLKELVALNSGPGSEWTAAMRYDFQPTPDTPLGVEVRTTSLRRGADDVQLWSFRLCYRIPDRPVNHRPAGRGRGRR